MNRRITRIRDERLDEILGNRPNTVSYPRLNLEDLPKGAPAPDVNPADPNPVAEEDASKKEPSPINTEDPGASGDQDMPSDATQAEQETEPSMSQGPLGSGRPNRQYLEGRRVLDLREALGTAFRLNRDYLFQREGLLLTALTLRQIDHDFTPQLTSSLFYAFSDVLNDEDQSIDWDFLATQILPFGGQASVGLNTNGLDPSGFEPGTDFLFSDSLSASVSQPLLRGFGRRVTYEPLVQAERSLTYAIRDFQLFREDLSIQVANQFYDLVSQKQQIENEYTNLESSEFAYQQADALFKVGRTNELDALRARRQVLTARDRLLQAQESYQLALDNFRIFMGLPDDDPIDVQGDPPDFIESNYDLYSAIEVALENRLDLRTEKNQLEDVERRLLIAQNGLLPDLDLSLNAFSSFDGGDGPFAGTSLGESYDVRISLDIPLDRVDDTAAYRRAQITVERSRRSLEQFTDTLVVGIQRAFRELNRRLQSLQIQETLILDATKRLRIAELRFERGELSNRDVVEANLALLDAQNTLINEKVRYEIARLQLLSDLGILFIDENGMWQ